MNIDNLQTDETTVSMLERTKFTRSMLSKSMRRSIKDKEKYLERTCRKIWAGKSRDGIVYLYANFCKNYDKVIITLGYYVPTIGFITLK